MTTQPESLLSRRWDALPGDPPALRRWLAEQSGAAADDDWPQEESR